MDFTSLAIFTAAYAIMVATPGPGIAALVARVLGRGTKGAPAFIAGYVIGDLCWFTGAALGLSAIAKTFATAFLVIKYIGAAYLLYLAYKMWATPVVVAARDEGEDATPRELFTASLTLTLGNPKPMAFFLALLPTVIDLEVLTPLAFAELAIIIAVVLAINQALYVILADRARRFVSDVRAMRIVNRICDGALVGAAAAVVR
ncbi:LysE family translocator [Microvirga alba]|uniref:LysE family translocator n=1 Tax=Microvirga alba TaxID=2791025 RepID=A0A931BML1_9HYPH|nr:LysE family translocator [Microvirga alba]MBF9234016.1 LysE family translocator [Microvirga alba]